MKDREPHPNNILIVEDSMGVARALQRALGLYMNGHQRVTLCDSGETALQKIHELSIDLLISDLRLPGMDGLDLLERVRKVKPGTRTILITAYGSAEVEALARKVANAYLAKPFRLQDLVRLVERVLDEPVQPPVVLHPPAGWSGKTGEEWKISYHRKSAHLNVLACDLDGTLAVDGQVDLLTLEALRHARLAGINLILVTGRNLDRIEAEFPFAAELCEAIVAENGAVIYYPRRETVELPYGRIDPRVLKRLEAMGVPLERGMAIASTWTPHDEAVRRTLQEYRSSAVIEYNREAVMVLPAGATKGSGLSAALQELGLSPHNVVACGDAENDRSLFSMAELSIAVANAQPALLPHADTVLSQEDGLGIQAFVKDFLEGKVLSRPPRPERLLVLGYRLSGTPVELDPFTLIVNNLGIFGSSGSGKSWLAGLLAEEMLKKKYQVCIIDPEGDYRGLGASPHTLLLGGSSTPLPPVPEVMNISEWNPINLVLDLSMCEVDERLAYMQEFLRALRGMRARRGRPHWFLVDEIQSFCPVGGGPLAELFLEAMQWGGFSLISYRVSQIDPALLAALGHLLITRLRMNEELEALRPHLHSFQGGEAILEQLFDLPKGQAYLCLDSTQQAQRPGKEVFKFRVGQRAVPHIRHLHKYLRALMPEAKRFYFFNESGQPIGRAAASLWEFREALSEIPSSSIQHHLLHGDFELWLRDVLHDEKLAHQVHELGQHPLEGEALRRIFLEVVIKRYEELEMLD